MSQTIVIASGKGGVGKSTASAALGRAFAAAGKKTLLIDCDAGLSSLDVMLGVRDKVLFSWYDAYLGNCTAAEALIEAGEGLFLIAAPGLPLYEEAADAIIKTTENLTEEFDVIIRDAPAGLGAGLVRAASGAEMAVIVATADEVSVKGAAAVADIIRKNGVGNIRLLINRYDIKAAAKGKLLSVDELIDKSMVRLLGIIPEDKDIVYSTVTNIRKPNAKSAKAFIRTAQRLDGKNVDLILSLLK